MCFRPPRVGAEWRRARPAGAGSRFVCEREGKKEKETEGESDHHTTVAGGQAPEA